MLRWDLALPPNVSSCLSFPGPYASEAGKKLHAGWEELQRRTDLAAIWINHNLGPHWCALKRSTAEYWKLAQVRVQEGWAWLKPQALALWSRARPQLEALGAAVVAYVNLAAQWLQKNGPVYAQLAYDTAAAAVKTAANTVDGWING